MSGRVLKFLLPFVLMVLVVSPFIGQGLITVGLVNLANVTSLPILLLQAPLAWPTCPKKQAAAPIDLLPALRVTEQHSSNSDYWRAVARSYWLSGRCAEAIEAWLNAQRLGNRQSDQLILAQWYLGTESRARAIETYLKADAASFVHKIWEQARSSGNTSLALSWQDLYVDLRPSRENVQWLSSTYMLFGRATDAAMAWHKLATVTQENDPDHWFAIGHKAQTLGDCKTALDLYRHGQEVTSDAPVLLTGQADCLAVLGNLDNAITIYERLFAGQNDASTAAVICNLRRQQKRLEQARTWCDRAIALPHDGGAPEYYLGLLLQDMGDWRGSEQALRQSVARYGKGDYMVPVVYYPLAQVVYRQSRYDEAMSLLEVANSLLDENYPDKHKYISLLSDWYSRRQTDHP